MRRTDILTKDEFGRFDSRHVCDLYLAKNGVSRVSSTPESQAAIKGLLDTCEALVDSLDLRKDKPKEYVYFPLTSHNFWVN